ncbi:MAG: ABC transporter permease [Elusimicrobia bacterium]|jgi:phospholipid/cholesterol/gamma-HCH transport system permease protein|nr:ABC transporter permease [Elusimicrobiota bacterium]
MNKGNIINSMQSSLTQSLESFGGAADMVRKISLLIFKKPDEPANILKQMVRVGVNSIPIVLLSSFFTGMVLALQSGVASIRLLNQPVFMGSLVAFSMVLELGPVLTAMVIAGRVGASITAETGTMKVSEQLDALYMLGTTPEKYLGVPLFIATIIMVPILTLIADIVGITGGYIAAVTNFDVPGSVYINEIVSYLKIVHVFNGLIKSAVFGFIIVTVSCYKGFTTSGGAEGVGESTTRAVVYSMIFILISDYFLSMLLNSLGMV